MKESIRKLLAFFLLLNVYIVVCNGQKIVINGYSSDESSINPLINGVNLTVANYGGGIYAQMLQDRGFEWNPAINDRWIESATGVETFVQRDSLQKVGGKYSGKMSINGYTNQLVYVYTDAINIEKDKEYDFSIWVKSSGYADSISFHLGWSANSMVVEKPMIVKTIPSQWQKYSFVFKANSTQQNTRLYISFFGNGTVWLESASLMPSNLKHGIRNEVMNAFDNLGLTFARFPNGFEGNVYKWQEAIGEKDTRNTQVSADALIAGLSNLAETPYYNDFGIDEFLQLCEYKKIEPLLLLKIAEFGQTSDVQNALNLIEYCNGDSTTNWGKVRKQNGRALPYHVKYVELGNEQFNQVMPAPGSIKDDGVSPFWTRQNTLHYIDRVNQISAALKKTFPYIKIGVVGANDYHVNNSYLSIAIDPKWDSLLLANAAKNIDFICPHDYAPGETKDNPYYGLMAANTTFEKAHNFTLEQIKNSQNPNIKLCISEFAVNYDFIEDVNINFRLKSALYFSLLKNLYIKQNLMGACFYNFKDDGYFGLIDQKYWENGQTSNTVLQSAGYKVFNLYKQYQKNIIVPTITESSTFNCKTVGWMPAVENVPYLNCLATTNMQKDSLYLIVTNSDTVSNLLTTIVLNGFTFETDKFDIATINGLNTNSMNTYSNSLSVDVTSKVLVIDTTQSINYLFPAHSITAIKFSVKYPKSTAIVDTENNSSLVLSPNPFNSKLTISFTDAAVSSSSPYLLEIFNGFGEKVYCNTINTFPYTLYPKLSENGVYVLMLTSKNNYFVRKVIFEK